MIDMHSHVLPLVDDGSQDMKESLEMIAASARSGVRILAVTPHANQFGRFENYYKQDIKQKFLTLKQAAEEASINIRLVFGMEIFSSYDLEELLEAGMLCGLNGTKYFLIEFPFDADLRYMNHCINGVHAAGGIPVIAHPERYTAVQRHPGILYSWIQDGICTQVNKSSISGSFGPGPKKTAEFMFAFDLVTCVGSDAHGTEMRTTDMSRFRQYLLKNYGPDYTRKITRDRPFLILKGEPVPIHGIRPSESGRSRTESRSRVDFW